MPFFVTYLLHALDLFLRIYLFLLFIRIIISWFRIPDSPVLQYLHTTTEPYLALFRRLPLRIGMFDLSPIVALYLLNVIHGFIVSLIP